MAWIAVAAGLAAGCDGAGPNEPPIAALTADPQVAAPGAPVALDASGSRDPDGFLIAYRWDFGDGSPVIATAAAATTHAFAAAGTREVAVTAIDDRGAESTARATVQVLGQAECDEARPCPAGEICVDGTCRCADDHVVCGDECVDPATDPRHCGGCDRPCAEGECVGGVCEMGCPPEAPLTCPDGACVDPMTDPANCGECGNVCLSGVCLMGGCEMLPPGSVLDVLAPPPFAVTRGLTHVNGEWYLTTGRRFVRYDPVTGANLGHWFLQNEATRRTHGLAGFVGPDGTILLATGSYNRFGSPLVNVRLDVYVAFGGILTSAEQLGGPMATDGTTLWVFYNDGHQLIEIDVASASVTSVAPVVGLAPGDWFTDLALDGYGGLWAVRPDLQGPTDALMCKLAVATASLEYCIPPPSPEGLGGVVLVDGALWGVGAAATFRMVP